MITLIGDHWLRNLNERAHDPSDFLQIELVAALEREIPVVPVLIGRATMPEEKELPEQLALLAYRNAADLRAGPDMTAQLDRLVSGMRRLLGSTQKVKHW